MEKQVLESPLHFRFIWIPDPEHNTSEEQNEVLKRTKEYESAMSLFKEDTSFKSDFKVAMNLQQLSTSLVQIDGYRPVFILLGHGDEDGNMYFMSNEVLTTQILATSVATITCDVIATQCGANKFVSAHDHVELVGLINVRFLAGSEVYSESTLSYQLKNGQFVHKELMQLMINYARHYSHEAQDVAVLEVLAMLATLGTDRDGWISTFFQEISELSTSTILIIVLFIVILLFAFAHYMRRK